VDLQRWLTGAYVMPASDEDETPGDDHDED
jgi:endogenous inhibitor of DNA gyrase (YacG/DUF329 family)